MSNAEHYALEERLRRHIDTMSQTNLRHYLKQFVTGAAVPVVNQLATALRFETKSGDRHVA